MFSLQYSSFFSKNFKTAALNTDTEQYDVLHDEKTNGWEKPAIELARTRTRHFKNTRVVCRMPKTLYDVLINC